MGLSIQNSWHKEGGLWQDPDLQRVKNSPLHYRPRSFSPADCQPDSVLTLRGPRRAGKTVVLKLLVAELIETQIFRPDEILWTSFEAMRTLDQAEERLSAIAAERNVRLVVVDEVTTVVGWQRLIKKFKDEGSFTDLALVLTGSSAHDLKKGAERMAGRRGTVENPDRVLLPMSFLQFEKQITARMGPLSDSDLISLYCQIGGFPFRVEIYLKSIEENRKFGYIRICPLPKLA